MPAFVALPPRGGREKNKVDIYIYIRKTDIFSFTFRVVEERERERG